MEKCEEEGSKSGHHGASEANSKTQGIVIVPNPSPYHFMIGPDWFSHCMYVINMLFVLFPNFKT